MESQMDQLIEKLKYQGVLRSLSIENALRKVDRSHFIPEFLKSHAYDDTALPIGYDQTISQPFTVVLMLEYLNIKPGNNVLEIGYGSGWQTAILAHLVGEKGAVYSMEVIPELCRFGKINISQYSTLEKRIEFYCKNAVSGLPEVAEDIGGFDRVICAADVNEVPQAWREQMKIDGILVYPKKGVMYKEIKLSDNKFDIEYYTNYRFLFVPFVEDA